MYKIVTYLWRHNGLVPLVKRSFWVLFAVDNEGGMPFNIVRCKWGTPAHTNIVGSVAKGNVDQTVAQPQKTIWANVRISG